jgi:hypothetical protein
LFRGTPVFYIKNGIYQFDTDTESLSLLISEVGDPAAMAITDSALVVADGQTLWVKDGDSAPRELAAESVFGAAAIVPDSLCIGENGRIYVADTSGVIWQIPIDAFATPASISVQSVAETSSVTALTVVDKQLVYASPAEVGVITVEPAEAYTTAVSSSVIRPATNGTDIITGHEQTVTHLRFDNDLRTAAAYEVTAPIEHVQLAGRNAVVTTTTGTTVIDLATGNTSTRGGKIRYIGPHYTIADRDGETQLRINVQR